MKDKKCRYTLRADRELLDKLQYISEYEGRTKNKQLLYMIEVLVESFEHEHGKITLNDKEEP